MLAVPLDGFAQYQREEAWTWEHMALCRARPVYGSADGRRRVAALVGDEIVRLGQLAASRGPVGEDVVHGTLAQAAGTTPL